MGNRQPQLATLCYIKKDGQTLMLHRIKKKNDVHQGKWGKCVIWWVFKNQFVVY